MKKSRPSLQLSALDMQGQSLQTDATTLGFGVAAGLMVTFSNVLLLESLTHLDVGREDVTRVVEAARAYFAGGVRRAS